MTAGLVAAYPRHVLALALASGLALAPAPEWLTVASAGLIAILLIAQRAGLHVVIAAAALLLAGAGAGSARLAAIDADPLSLAPRGEVTLRGHLITQPRERGDGATLRIRANGNGQLVEVRLFERLAAPLGIGDEVMVRGRLRPVQAERTSSPESQRYADYLRRNGVRRRISARSVEATGERRGGAYGIVDSIRTRSERSLALGLQREPAGLLRGMVLGGDAGLAESTAENFRVSGLAHILAVSGQNVLLIVILVQAILIACGADRRARLLVPAAVIVIYVLLCGAQASVIRAGAMGLAGLAALAASRPSSRIYALILASIAVLAWNPRATADVGAQLSFAAVLGIMAFAQPLAGLITRLPEWAAQAFGATAGATVATAPLMAFHFEAVSLVSLAANVVGEPLIGPIVWLGSLTAALGQLSPEAGALLNAPNSFLLASLIELARGAAATPGAQASLEGFDIWLLALSYLPVLLAAALANRLIALPRLMAPSRSTRSLGFLAAAIVVLSLAWSLRPADRTRAPAVAMLDVGQGDAMLVTGERCHALIDAGSAGRGLGRSLHRLGVEKLDALLITHAEDDHFAGALELTRDGGMEVGTFIDGGGTTSNPEYAELRARMRTGGTRVEAAVAGLHWSCPGLAIEVISPPALPRGAPSPAQPNARSAVTRIDVRGIRVLASGDAESQHLSALVLGPVDVLKVPHHGSADPGAASLLARTTPTIALIGVGAENRYGHPTPQALTALRSAGARVFRTDWHGTVAVRRSADGTLRVTRER